MYTSMHKLNFPDAIPRLQTENGVTKIFDTVRRKWLVLTPEEWVRQHLVTYLHSHKSCPLGLMAIERSLKMNGMVRRSDVVVFGRNNNPLLLAECKAPGIRLSQRTFDQAARYNMTLRVPYLMITNGLEHFCCRIDFEHQSYAFLPEIPDFTEMSAPAP
jgi:hypothetical protein